MAEELTPAPAAEEAVQAIEASSPDAEVAAPEPQNDAAPATEATADTAAPAATDATPETPQTPEAAPEAAAPETAPAAPEVPAASAPEGVRPRRANAPVDLMPDLKSSGAPSEEKEVEGGRNYELTYIVNAGIADAGKTSSERVRALVEATGGAVDNVRISEVRRLAYPIEKQIDGVYVVINARFQKTLTGELDRLFKLEESVLRHLILREDA